MSTKNVTDENFEKEVLLKKFAYNQIKEGHKNPKVEDKKTINYNKICDLDLTSFNSTNDKYTTLKRSILIKFLKEKLLSNSIIFRKEISKVEKKNEKINIHFIDGSSDEVDYLVISDGIFSNTKSIIEKKNFKAIYYGAIAIRTQIETQDISNFDSNNISLVMGSNAHIVLYPINQQKEINLVCIIRKK